MVAVTRWTGAALAAAGWVVVLAALWFTPPTADQTRDLEAGGGFAASVEVYLPALVLSAGLLAVLVVGAALRRPDVAALVTGGTTAAFAGWVVSRDYLVAYLPGLVLQLVVGVGLGLVGLNLGLLAWRPRPVRQAAPHETVPVHHP